MDAVVSHSQASITQGSTSFRAASRLFGRQLREDVWQFYAWCRRCDDEIDGQDHGGASAPLTPEERRRRLERLQALTHRAMAGEPVDDPAFIALQRVSRRHQLPQRWADELLAGFAMDVDGRRFEAPEDTLAYCWGVAGVVGVMMAAIMGARDPEVLKRAQDLGLAFQLTNICRDVREDAENGRIYLPQAELRKVGLAPDVRVLLDPANRAAVFKVVEQELELAERYYASARRGLRALPFRGALAVSAARGVYREIGRRILRAGPEALATRASVPKPVMAWLLVRGAMVAAWSRVERLTPPSPRPALWSRL